MSKIYMIPSVFIVDKDGHARWRKATDAEIKEAHPKCCHPDGTPWCKHWIIGVPPWDYCDFLEEVEIRNPSTFYCPHHTEITGDTPHD